jgi:myosin heavy subunit
VFNKQLFETEVELFRSEGILAAEAGHQAYPNNLECVDLLAGRSYSVLSLLDEEMRKRSPTDLTWCRSLHDTLREHPNFVNPLDAEPESPKQTAATAGVHRTPTIGGGAMGKFEEKNQFIIHHFAGHVTYSVGSFCEKNGDKLPQEVRSLPPPATVPAHCHHHFPRQHPTPSLLRTRPPSR